MSADYIVVRLQGGLGNQMFQYAFGRALSMRGGMELYLDTSPLNPKKNRGCQLDAFTLSAKFADPEKIQSLITPHFAIRKKLWKVLKIPFKYADTHILEKDFPYDKDIASRKTSAYFDGYWQTEKYFSDCKEFIRRDFSFHDEEVLRRHVQYEEVLNSNSVSIHIRRGDYVKNPKYRKRLYVCKLEYYKNAMKFLAERFENLTFYIASDDHEWVKHNFALSKQVRLIESENALSDFYIMSRCRHNIISNSSFSWWAAWLNPNESKQVLAPDIWFNPCAKIDFRDIAPDSWVKIETYRNENRDSIYSNGTL